MNKKPTMKTKRTAKTGTNIGLKKMIIGAKRIKPMMVTTNVRHVRKREMVLTMKRVKRPKSWVEFETCFLINGDDDDELVVLMVMGFGGLSVRGWIE